LNIGKRTLLFSGILLLVGFGILLLSGSIVNRYLSLYKPLQNANLLIVEGWLSDEELKGAAEIFTSNVNTYKYIITTGVLLPSFYEMGENGDLVFNINVSNLQTGAHKLSVEAYSTNLRGEYALFSAWVNNKKVGQAITSGIKKKYSFDFEAHAKTESVTIRFLNDNFYKKQDINLYVASISIDNLKYVVNDTSNYYIKKYQPEVKHVLAKTNDVRAKYVLMRYHVPENKIIAIGTLMNSVSRTAQTAKNTINVLDSIFDVDTIRINILSRKPHSRRTYLAYNKYFGKPGQIGIINSKYSPARDEKRMLKNLKELFGILYLKITPK
jgi:hypothetical protein